jgi:hydrazine synthase alpha subunit-like protein/WD40 repeat protein
MLKPTLHHASQTTLALLAAGILLAVAGSGCRDSAPDDLIQPETTTEALVFVKTPAEETLNRTWAEGNLYKLSPISPDGIVTPITNFTGASISDPSVSFDGKTILFSMRPSGGSNRNIYEIRPDGTGLRQVTSGGGHDFDPLYLPDGRIMFTSSRAGEMDEYNHAPAEHLYVCDADGANPERVSFNQSDDFDPTLLPDGRIMFTRWEHFGTMNRFPLFFTNPDGSGTFHLYGPHSRNFFHPTPTPDGRLLAIESTMIEEDAGPLAILKTEQGPADPVVGMTSNNWDVVTVQVNNDGAPWPYGAFKYPHSIGANLYVASYSLPAANEGNAGTLGAPDYGLYTFSLTQAGTGTASDPASFTLANMTFLYNDPAMNEYDAQLLAPRAKPPIIPTVVDRNVDYGIFLAQDVFNRGSNDGQERPVEGATGLNRIDSIAVLAARPTMAGEANNFSANDFEKRALIGFAPVQPDGSFRIKVPANTPISFATLDSAGRGFVVKRTHLSVRPGEEFNKCVGCHEDRGAGGPVVTNPTPMAGMLPAHDLNIPPAQFQIINYQQTIGPIVAAKCASCHYAGVDTIPAAGTTLDLSAVPDTTEMNRVFPRGYINLSGEGMMAAHQVVDPAFPRRSLLIDYVLGLGTRAGQPPHPTGTGALTAEERRLFNLWVLLGAQYR